ncbi:Alpha/Beta hydrolase protein [Diaporthe sp. PMI_573]|nr:Alpha/Beta hydrolase protein [Diaporthaceae sp. PMI_573]
MSSLKNNTESNSSFGYEALRAAGYSNYGGADIAEVISICSRIRSGNEADWMREWKGAADRAATSAQESQTVGNVVSASEAFLRASNYYRTAEFYLRDDPTNNKAVLELSGLCAETFVSALELMPYSLEKIEIPYEKTTLPGYFIHPAGVPVPRPTIIFNGGFDSVKEEAWFAIAAPAVQRGFNVVAFDGPGQGEALRRQGLVFRPDWENVVTPVMDYTLGRPEVESSKVVIFGWSMGGYLAARAAAGEHRAAALILDDGVFDFSSAFYNKLPGLAKLMIDRQWDSSIEVLTKPGLYLDTQFKWGMLNAKWTFGAATVAEFFRKVKEYTLAGRVESIITPTLVLDAPDDHFLKGQPELLFEKLTCEKTLVQTTREEGASTHCHLGAFSRLHQVIFDHLSKTL